MDSLQIAVRVDGDDRIGAGHVARCIPLARALSALGHRPILIGTHTGLAGDLLAQAGIDGEPASTQVPTGVSASACDAAILDSYEIPSADICQLARELPVATLAEARRCPDRGVLIDYHLDRIGEQPTASLLPGPAYTPIDPRFAAGRRPRTAVERVLVTAGGSKVGNDILQTAVAAVRAVFPKSLVLSTSDVERTYDGIELLPRRSQLWNVVGEVDLAVSTAGLTAYELACAGVPAVLIAVAENQHRVARACAAAGTALVVDAVGKDPAASLHGALTVLLDPARRSALAARGVELLDGRGAERSAHALMRCWKQN